MATEKNITYYNEVAANYDAILAEDNSNTSVRQLVADIFCRSVAKGRVLDFGGGTGQDIHWLLKNGYTIIFCEPAVEMRKQAIANNPSSKNIIFLDGAATDHRTWSRALPFTEKVQGALLNFAVLNCIDDLQSLFRSLSSVAEEGAIITALILQSDMRSLFKKSYGKALYHLVTGAPFFYQIKYHDKWQTVYLHTYNEIEKATAVHFSVVNWQPIKDSGFTILQLIKK